MARKKQVRGKRPVTVPGTILREVTKIRTTEQLIEDLAVDHRAKAAYWRLRELGNKVALDVEAGMKHPDPRVRAYCCVFFDHHLTERAYPLLLDALDDPDPRVRFHAAHAIECERCKAGAWAPPREVRDAATKLLAGELSSITPVET